MVEDDRNVDGRNGADRDRMDPTTFEVTHGELRTTFEYQVQRLQEIDGKAIEILKANLLLIGILVTGGSILVQTDLDIAPFINSFSMFGGLLLLVSTGLAAVTYTASNLRGGLDADAVETAIATERDTSIGRTDPPFEERLLRSYVRWIDYNARVTAVNDMLATVTVLLVFVAFVYVVAGVVVATLTLPTVVTAVAFVVTTLVVAAFIRVAYHMDHLGFEADPRSETFAGVRLSKGTSRREGLSVLRGMLAGGPQEDEPRRRPAEEGDP